MPSVPPALLALWSMKQKCAVILCPSEYQRQKCLVYLSRCGFLRCLCLLTWVRFELFCASLELFVFIWWRCNRNTRLSAWRHSCVHLQITKAFFLLHFVTFFHTLSLFFAFSFTFFFAQYFSFTLFYTFFHSCLFFLLQFLSHPFSLTLFHTFLFCTFVIFSSRTYLSVCCGVQ